MDDGLTPPVHPHGPAEPCTGAGSDSARDLEQQARRLAALAEPVRRDLYLHVASSDELVSRDTAAHAVGVSRSLAAHHLDRLAADGLLEVEYRRLTGRSGPGAGRPAKLYRRARTQVTVNLPPRRYALAGLLLAEAVERGGLGADPVETLEVRARAHGHALGARVENTTEPAGQTGRSLRDVLAAEGYEPTLTAEGLDLRNCPFHALVAEHRALVCGMNLALLQGLVDGLDTTRERWSALADPRENRCCVRLASV